MKETVLLFHVEDKTMKLRIEQALFPFHIRLKKIPPQDYGKTLGVLAGIVKEEIPAEAYGGDELDAPMMIFAGIPDPKLDAMLRSLRAQNVRLPYKAILTPTNMDWTPPACFAELKQEHEAMTAKRPAPEA